MTSTSGRKAVDEFRVLYERHVMHVVEGDLKAVMSDMHPACVPVVFEGVELPGRDVDSAAIRSAQADGAAAVGEAVYRTASGAIGLRSFWVWEDARWLAVRLENFPTEGGTDG